MREVNGGASDESARTSLKRGASPSRFAVLEMGRDSKLAAKERAAAMERSPDHRVTKAATQAERWVTAALRARARASKRSNTQPFTDVQSSAVPVHNPKARPTAYCKELQRRCTQSAFTPHGRRSGAGERSQRGCGWQLPAEGQKHQTLSFYAQRVAVLCLRPRLHPCCTLLRSVFACRARCMGRWGAHGSGLRMQASAAQPRNKINLLAPLCDFLHL